MKKTQEQSILHDAYFNKPPCFTRLFLVRLVLLCGLTVSALLAIADLYIIQIDLLMPCILTAVFTAAIYTLASLFPSGLVYLASLGCMAGVLFNEEIRERLTYFADFLLIRLDSRLLKTADFLFHKKENILPDQVADGCLLGLILIGVLLSVTFTAATRTRFHSFYVTLTFAALIAPVFAAEIAGFHESIAFFASFFAGFCAISSAYDLDGLFVFEKSRLATEAALRNEKSYRKRMRFSVLGRKLRSDIPRYLKYSGNSVIAVLVTFGLVLLSAQMIPSGKTFDYEEIFSEVQDLGFKIAEDIENNFGIHFGGTETAYNEYFTYEQYGDTSGGIGISKPSNGDRPVLDVLLERNDIPIYLKGDIGVSFTGTEWTAIRDEYDSFTDSDGVKFSEKLKDFYPETQNLVTRQKMKLVGYSPDEFLPLQKVSVTYHRKTGVVFQPMSAYDLDYKQSTLFESYGDTVLRTKNGGFNTFESLALTPDMNFSPLNALYHNTLWMTEQDWSVDGMTGEEYNSYIKAYEQFVGKAYAGDVPEYIDGLISSLSSGYINDATPMAAADGICRYFKDNFTYSLTVDNGDGKEILENFLYKTKEGHCALFATAMTLAMREMGYTARYVTGYVASGNGNFTSDGYLYTLREKDLHAWVEVYCPGIGWLPYDPTAYVSGYADTEPERTTQNVPFTSLNTADIVPDESETFVSEEDEQPPLIEQEQSDTPTTRPPDGTDEGNAANTPPADGGEGAAPAKNSIAPIIITILIILAVAAALVLALYFFVKRVNNAEKRVMSGFRKKAPHRAVEEMYRLVMLILSKQGLTPGCEMMTDFAERVDSSIFLKGTNVFMIDVIDIFIKSEFGNHEISPITDEERASVYKFTLTIYRKYMEKHGFFMKFIIKITLFL